MSIDVVGRVNIFAIARRGRIKIGGRVNHTARKPVPPVCWDTYVTEQLFIQDLFQVTVPQGGKRLAKAAKSAPGFLTSIRIFSAFSRASFLASSVLASRVPIKM